MRSDPLNHGRPASRIGLTMRVVGAEGYDETRDAIARDWPSFLSLALPDIDWIAIPNLGDDAVTYCRRWEIDGLVLTGGGEPGDDPQRDRTEKALIAHCRTDDIPVLGICRGLQVIVATLDGRLDRCDRSRHVANRHPVTFEADLGPVAAGTTLEVNSFHGWGIRRDAVPDALRTVAATDDGWVEALVARRDPIVGLMWHPEREPVPSPSDRGIIRTLFGLPVDTPPPAPGR
jgi:gamma-glutamyl-gamma-aminobutyrate hydrolase PuuD